MTRRRALELAGLVFLGVLAFGYTRAPFGLSSVRAATIVVNTENDDTTADDDLCTLREAIANANSDSDTTQGDCLAGTGADLITFTSAVDVIQLTSNITVSDTDGLTINGGGHVTIDGMDTNQPFRNGLDYGLIFRGITITRGFAFSGGAIINYGHLEIIDSTLTDNHADYNGGAIATSRALGGSTVIVRNSTINENTAVNHGGGIYAENDHVEIHDSFVEDNTAGVSGGGIAIVSYGAADTLEVYRSSISGNEATSGSGGGILNSRDHVEIYDSVIHNNKAPGGYGGGIATSGEQEGTSSTLVLVRSTVSSNRASAGGGIFNNNDYAQILNSTVSGNLAGSGGGGGIFSIVIPGGQGPVGTLLINSTVAFNESTPLSPNSGIHNEGAPDTVVLWNTIVAENTPVDCSDPLTSLGNNLDSDGTCSLTAPGDIPNGNANLGPLADNGGPTRTHALLRGSAAIDTANTTGCLTEGVNGIDQRGVVRPIDGDGNGTALCDIGAYEREPPTPSPTPRPEETRVPQRPPNIGAGLSGLFAGQPTPLPTAPTQAVAPSTTIRPPSTGDGGLR